MDRPAVTSIQEILDLAEAYHMPLEKMRFFIGQDIREPKAYGIYQMQDGRWIVYKNKSDGTRAVRYAGNSEAEASRIIFEKLSDEIAARKKDAAWWEHQEQMASDGEYAYEYEKEIASRKGFDLREIKNTPARKISRVYTASLIGLAGMAFIAGSFIKDLRSGPSLQNGYYKNPDGDVMVYCNDQWYAYDDGWYPAQVSDTDAYEYEGSYYNDESWSEDFTDTSYYETWSSDYDQSDHDDYDYDYDDWDTGDTDWDTDW